MGGVHPLLFLDTLGDYLIYFFYRFFRVIRNDIIERKNFICIGLQFIRYHRYVPL